MGVEATDTDPLLDELQSAARRRGGARTVPAGVRTALQGLPSVYTWDALAEAAGLAYSTAWRVVTSDAVTVLDQILDGHPPTPAPVWLNPPRRDAEHDNVLLKLSQSVIGATTTDEYARSRCLSPRCPRVSSAPARHTPPASWKLWSGTSLLRARPRARPISI